MFPQIGKQSWGPASPAPSPELRPSAFPTHKKWNQSSNSIQTTNQVVFEGMYSDFFVINGQLLSSLYTEEITVCKVKVFLLLLQKYDFDISNNLVIDWQIFPLNAQSDSLYF